MKNVFFAMVVCALSVLVVGCAGNQAFRAMPEVYQTAYQRCYPIMERTVGDPRDGMTNMLIMRPIMNQYVEAGTQEERKAILLSNGCPESMVNALFR